MAICIYVRIYHHTISSFGLPHLPFLGLRIYSSYDYDLKQIAM